MTEYVFQEFPKWIQPEGREPLIVQSRDEEERELGLAPQEPATPDNLITRIGLPRRAAGRQPRVVAAD